MTLPVGQPAASCKQTSSR